jgi:hypothetical protein
MDVVNVKNWLLELDEGQWTLAVLILLALAATWLVKHFTK